MFLYSENRQRPNTNYKVRATSIYFIHINGAFTLICSLSFKGCLASPLDHGIAIRSVKCSNEPA